MLDVYGLDSEFAESCSCRLLYSVAMFQYHLALAVNQTSFVQWSFVGRMFTCIYILGGRICIMVGQFKKAADVYCFKWRGVIDMIF